MLAEWQAVLARLRERIGEHSFKAWLDPIRCFRDERGFRLEVPSSFCRDWVAHHFLTDIRTELHALSGADVDVRLVVVEAETASCDSAARVEAEEASASAPLRQPPARKRPVGAARTLRIGQLMESYTFERFVVGPSNELAYSAALAVAEKPSRTFNPLFLWGGVGLGKTHLISAIAHRFLAGGTRRRIAFLSAEEFMNQMIAALRQDQMRAFRDRFRDLDLLVVDDVEFLAGKERTQEEFFHTFDALFTAGKQVVLTSDQPPQAIPQLADRLRSRFEGGLNADIRPPTKATRLEIVRSKAADQKVELGDAVAALIVERSGESVRELEGALTRVLAWAELRNMPIDEASVARLLAPVSRAPGRVSIAHVLETTGKYFGIAVDDLRSHGRERAIADARQIAMFLCRTLCDCSYATIAEAFNGRDHSTIVYAVNRVEKRRPRDVHLDLTLSTLERTLRDAAASRVA